ncbi:MAG: DUF4145 domain-containing protein [Bacteroidetes bacterium]|nr:DUF4145 domain-containing protein [Bacteroidota bacterium]
MIIVQKKAYNKASGYKLVTTCPLCGKAAIFNNAPNTSDISTSDGQFTLGQRICPNPNCQLHLFFVQEINQTVITFPALRIDFDSSNIPEKIKKSFEEAIICHSESCFIAAAIMIRRTLEDLCEDRDAKGKNLQDKILALKSKVILPEDLFNALDDLRLLGNDAAHIESKTYDDIGNNEIEIGIELTKEILKACYQLKDLVKKLNRLKKTNVS